MSDPISLIEAWLTYVNVQLLGLKPFHVNLIKTTTLLLGSGLVLWMAISKSSERPIALVLERLRGGSARKIIAASGVLLTVVVSYLSLRQFYMYTAASYDLAIYANTLWHVVH